MAGQAVLVVAQDEETLGWRIDQRHRLAAAPGPDEAAQGVVQTWCGFGMIHIVLSRARHKNAEGHCSQEQPAAHAAPKVVCI